MVSLVLPNIQARDTQIGDSGHPVARTKLTRKEYALLALLQENAGTCLSREFLLHTIWGYQTGTRTRTLDVHIQRLRRKLDQKSASRILTILREGYMWLPDGVQKRP
jgi:DNA-binding response OmpR family regulator